jgi:hypothetical protein
MIRRQSIRAISPMHPPNVVIRRAQGSKAWRDKREPANTCQEQKQSEKTRHEGRTQDQDTKQREAEPEVNLAMNVERRQIIARKSRFTEPARPNRPAIRERLRLTGLKRK